MDLVELENFPEGNPFHHDALNVGSRLKDVLLDEKYAGWHIMGAAYQTAYDLYLVNSLTGERVGIKL